MTAVITDIAPYLEKKFFETFSDARLITRYDFLTEVLNQGEGYDPNKDRDVKDLFPGGYDPVNNLRDNAEAIHREGVRRGVFKT